VIPYGRQTIEAEDIQAVAEVLRSDWLTTGPLVERFEKAVAGFAGARNAVAVSSGTAALHAAYYAAGIGPGDEVILPPMTFVATANAVVFQGGIPVFADVHEETLLIDPEEVQKKISPRTRAIMAVDYAGQPCDYDALRRIADRHGLTLIADACHSLGGEYHGRKVGALADLTVFSFHPVKAMTTGEGGMVVTDNPEFAEKMRRFRNHGLTTDHRQRTAEGTWLYEMVDLGYNYRLTDFQCALGLSQLGKLPDWIRRRREIARDYDRALAAIPGIRPLEVLPHVAHAYHLYVIRLESGAGRKDRGAFFQAMRAEGIGVNVHYPPVHLHPYYRQRFGARPGMCAAAEAAYERVVSLPIFPSMADGDVEKVTAALIGAFEESMES
jgi:perosamine synthetase